MEIQQTMLRFMKFQKKFKVLLKPWISLEFLESSWFDGFSGKSLKNERRVDISQTHTSPVTAK